MEGCFIFNSAVTLLDNASKKYPNNIAIEDDKNSYTFKEYNEFSLKIGTFILKNMEDQNQKGQVAVYLKKSCKNIISFMGTLYSGNSYVPFDLNMPKDRLAKILENLNPLFVITDTEGKLILEKELKLEANKILIFEDIINIEIDRTIIDKKLKNIIDTDPIYIMYTSGSTGMPKGVVIPHRGVIDYANWVFETFSLNQDTIHGNQAPFHFDNSILDIYTSLIAGSKVIIIPEVFFNYPVKLPDYINEKKINFIFWVPTVLINVANSEILENTKMPLLKKVLFCGEVMPNKQLNIWRKTHPNISYANLYGPTEITDVCTYYLVDQEFADNDSLPIGYPCENVGALILTSENKEAPPNEIGELCILGSGLSLGYFKDIEKTKKAFIQNPLNNSYRELIYRTGDLVFKNDLGQIIYIGRLDSQIKHKGNRIELGEIETIAKAVEELNNACVLYDNEKSEIVLFAEVSQDVKDRIILNKMRKYLPSYMVPSRVVKMQKIPLNPNGKLDRVFLKKYLGSDNL